MQNYRDTLHPATGLTLLFMLFRDDKCSEFRRKNVTNTDSNRAREANKEQKQEKASNTAQKMKFFIKDFFSKCDQIRRKPRIWSHLLKKSAVKNFIFCAVQDQFSEVQNTRSDKHWEYSLNTKPLKREFVPLFKTQPYTVLENNKQHIAVLFKMN